MSKKIREQIRKIYSFMESVYPANWQTRWSKTPYMISFADQKKIDDFVKDKGKLESVPGHVWSCIGFWMYLRKICPALDELVNSEEIYERLWVHDIGETYLGDISLASKVHKNIDEGKDTEREEFLNLVSILPTEEKRRLIKWFDEFEGTVRDKDRPLEALVARWIDHLQGDHFALTFGNNLAGYSGIVEKIVKKRSMLRSRNLIEVLEERSKRRSTKSNLYEEAAKEVEAVAKAHIQIIREAGIKLDLSELGF